MRRTVCAVVALLATAGSAIAGNSFIDPATRIEGCVAIVEEVRQNKMTPTEWLEANKEEFMDLSLELKKRKYPPDKAKGMMMGMAISLCMERKGFTNSCVTATGERGDLQIMRTAHVGECWERQRAEVPRPPERREEVVINPPLPQQPPPPLTPPAMSPADLAQFHEDMAVLTLPPTSVYPYGDQSQRFASCASYWQANLNYDRPPQVRQVLYSVRVARCMYRTGFGFFQAGCPREFPNMLNPGCYVRFG